MRLDQYFIFESKNYNCQLATMPIGIIIELQILELWEKYISKIEIEKDQIEQITNQEVFNQKSIELTQKSIEMIQNIIKLSCNVFDSNFVVNEININDVMSFVIENVVSEIGKSQRDESIKKYFEINQINNESNKDSLSEIKGIYEYLQFVLFKFGIDGLNKITLSQAYILQRTDQIEKSQDLLTLMYGHILIQGMNAKELTNYIKRITNVLPKEYIDNNKDVSNIPNYIFDYEKAKEYLPKDEDRKATRAAAIAEILGTTGKN